MERVEKECLKNLEGKRKKHKGFIWKYKEYTI